MIHNQICMEGSGRPCNKLLCKSSKIDTRFGQKCTILNLKPIGQQAIQTPWEQSLKINGARFF